MDRGLVDGLVTAVGRLGGKRWDIYVGALLYVAMTIVVTYPVTFRLSSELAGFDHQDSFEHLWMLWWGKKAIVDLRTGLANSSFIYYPLKVHHPMLAVEPYTKLVTIPLVMAFGPLIAYNLHFLASFVLTAFSAYLLCRYLTKNSLAAFIGGLIFAFFPQRTTHAMGAFIQIVMYWFPLYALSLFLLVQRPSVKRGFWCGLLLALSLLVGIMHIAYFVIPFTLIFFLYGYGKSRDKILDPLFWQGLAVAVGTAAVITAPFFIPFLIDKLSGGLTYLQRGGTVGYSADLWAFFTPPLLHPLFRRIGPIHEWSLLATFSQRGAFRENTAYVGFVPLALALWAAIKGPKGRGLWVILALATAILALGPLLKAGGQLIQYGANYIVLPYSLVKRLPFYEFGRTPVRLTETTMFAVAVLASYGSALALKRWRSRRVQAFLTGSLALLILFEYLSIFPFPTGGKGVPAFYGDIARDGQDYAVLDLPLGHRAADHYAVYYQTFHQHRIIGGHIYRVPLTARAMLSLMEGLFDPGWREDIVSPPTVEERLAVLNYSNVRYVVVHKSVMARRDPGSEEVMASFLRPFLGERLYEDEKIVVFGVPGASLEGRQLDPPSLLVVGEFWYEREEAGGIPTRWMGKQAVLYVVAPVGKRYRLAFSALSFQQPRDLKVWVEDEEVGEFAVEEAMEDLLTEEFSLRESWSVMRFEVQEACQKPSEVIPGSSDDRCLSLLLQGVRLVPVEEGS